MCKKSCYVCRKKKDENEGKIVLRHFICNDCLGDYLKSDSYCREKFLDIVWQMYIDKPDYYRLAGQYDNLILAYNFTPQGLLYALNYYMKRKEWNTEYLLHQAFPKLYYEARDYYRQELKIMRKIDNLKIHDTVDIKGTQTSYVPPLELK